MRGHLAPGLLAIKLLISAFTVDSLANDYPRIINTVRDSLVNVICKNLSDRFALTYFHMDTD